ncbi:hypothetical protein P7K49_033410 [Saguinus oedipus]|uniref:Uncharacterized protein n=1 Tax=Saguinus oedipus TaxID=9490 RepID=A0ABQ9TSW9_SAGOE|nr:hypothetical protein P7K49_033410 [Saguinus oedipus]
MDPVPEPHDPVPADLFPYPGRFLPPVWASPGAWAQGDRLSTATAKLGPGRAVSVSPSSLNPGVHLAADTSRTFPAEGKPPLSLARGSGARLGTSLSPSTVRETPERRKAVPGALSGRSCALQGWIGGRARTLGRRCALAGTDWAGLPGFRKDGFGGEPHKGAGGSEPQSDALLGLSLLDVDEDIALKKCQGALRRKTQHPEWPPRWRGRV